MRNNWWNTYKLMNTLHLAKSRLCLTDYVITSKVLREWHSVGGKYNYEITCIMHWSICSCGFCWHLSCAAVCKFITKGQTKAQNNTRLSQLFTTLLRASLHKDLYNYTIEDMFESYECHGNGTKKQKRVSAELTVGNMLKCLV